MDQMQVSQAKPNSDVEHLEALSYKSTFERSITLWENFSLGFTCLSPVVGVYLVRAAWGARCAPRARKSDDFVLSIQTIATARS